MGGHKEMSLRPVGRALLAAALAVAAGLGPLPGGAAPGPPTTSVPASGPATAAEWEEAIRVVRHIALDANRPVGQRTSAVSASARMLLARGQAAEALTSCRELFLKAGEAAVSGAALDAACDVARLSAGHLGGVEAMVEEWGKAVSDGAARQAALAARAAVARVRVDLDSAWTTCRPPEPQRFEMPAWGRHSPADGPRVLWMALPNLTPPRWILPAAGRGPDALQSVKPPVHEPPPWYARLPFPPAAEPKKK